MATFDGLKVKLMIGEKPEYRPCFYVSPSGNKMKALFHCWHNHQELVDASPFVGGHPGGAVSHLYAIIEFENGEVGYALPERIKFADSKGLFEQFCFEEDEKSFIEGEPK